MDRTAEIRDLLLQIQTQIDELPDRLKSAAKQVTVYQGLSEISERLGIIRAGEFRAGNNREPGRGFSGMRMAYPDLEYENLGWSLVGVNNDRLQFGVSSGDGKLYAAAGKLLIDQNSVTLNGLLYSISHSATNAGETRTAALGMWLPKGSNIPAWGITFKGGTLGDNIVPDDSFESGNLTTYWTQSGTSFSIISTDKYIGTYALKCDRITSGTKTLTSNRIACSGNTTYDITVWTKDEASSGDTTVRLPLTDDITIVSSTPNVIGDNNSGLRTGYNSSAGNSRALFKVDLSSIPINSIVTNADLFLYFYQEASNTNNTVSVHRLKVPYNAAQTTYNKRNNSDSWVDAGGYNSADCEQSAIGGIDVSKDEAFGWKRIVLGAIPLTNMLSDGSWTNNGFLMRSNAESGATITIPVQKWTIVGYHTEVRSTLNVYYEDTNNDGIDERHTEVIKTTVRVPDWGYVTEYVTTTTGDSLGYFRPSTDAVNSPYLKLQYTTKDFANYELQIKWYDNISAGSLIRTDIVAKNNEVTVWNRRNRDLTSPENAESFEIVIVASAGAPFYMDALDIHTVSIHKTLSFKPDLTVEDGDGNTYLLPPPFVMVTKTGQSISDTTWTSISFASAFRDTHSQWSSGDATKLTAKAAGQYKIDAQVNFASDTDGVRRVRITHSSAGTLSDDVFNDLAVNNSPTMHLSALANMAVNDYITIDVWHSAGENNNASCTAAMQYLGG